MIEDSYEIESTTVKHFNNIDYPTCKLNYIIFNPFLGINFEEWISVDNTRTNHKNKAHGGNSAVVMCKIEFDKDTHMSKELNRFDQQVLIAIDNLYCNGNDVVSITQIHKIITGKDPSSKQAKEIETSLRKLMTTLIRIDTTQEHRVYNTREVVKVEENAIVATIVSRCINGVITDQAIEIHREPVLLRFARRNDRNHYTSIPLDTWRLPIRRTKVSLELHSYLIRNISIMKNRGKRGNHEITFKTIFEKCGIKTANQKSRSPDTISKILEHYKTCDYIDGFKILPDKVIIDC